MTQAPMFAVVGHPNKGKSSVVATLSQNDAIAIALEPGTTRQRQTYALTVDGHTLYTLVDTPGFQRPRRTLEWLRAHSLSASDRAETVAAFVRQHRTNPGFQDECELLNPLTEGAGIIYVVDGSVPYSPGHEAEMTILRWTGQPSLALINSIGPDDHSTTWEAALGQFFQVVRRFDAVRADFSQHLGLLKAFGQLRRQWEQPLEEAINHLQLQREQRRRQAAEAIVAALSDMLRHREVLTLPASEMVGAHAREQLADNLRQRWYQAQRRREQRLRRVIEDLYQHHRIQRRETELDWHNEQDLFSASSQRMWGVDRRYLVSAGFGAGALGGVGIDAATLGTSLGAGALIGGLVGAAGSYFYGERLALSALRLAPMGGGVEKASFGPAKDSQFGYIVLGRAIDHWWHISRRNHAGRDPLQLDMADSHWLEQLPRQHRRIVQRAFDQWRKGSDLSASHQQQLAAATEGAFTAYDTWRLNMSSR